METETTGNDGTQASCWGVRESETRCLLSNGRGLAPATIRIGQRVALNLMVMFVRAVGKQMVRGKGIKSVTTENYGTQSSSWRRQPNLHAANGVKRLVGSLSHGPRDRSGG